MSNHDLTDFTTRNWAAWMHQQDRSCAIIATMVLVLGTPPRANAQRVFVGAGVGAASVPRSLTPLCGSARRLNGPTFSAQGGAYSNRLRAAATLDFTARAYTDAAECIANVGISVDSTFAPGSRAAMTAAGDVWIVAMRPLEVSVGAGWVPGHRSWFVSSGAGLQYRRIRAEATARWHRISFDEITRDFASGSTRELSRSSRTEEGWGGVVRLLLVTR